MRGRAIRMREPIWRWPWATCGHLVSRKEPLMVETTLEPRQDVIKTDGQKKPAAVRPATPRVPNKKLRMIVIGVVAAVVVAAGGGPPGDLPLSPYKTPPPRLFRAPPPKRAPASAGGGPA